MKLALGIIAKNEEVMLRKHLPILAPCFDGIIFGDDNSTDGTFDFLENELKCGIIIIPIGGDSFAQKRNDVIEEAEELGYDAILFLDADECMFPEHIENIREMLTKFDVIALARFEFGPDREHYNEKLFPDFQGRAFKLNKGYEYRHKLHEILYIKDHEKSVYEEKGFYFTLNNQIYHYGRCKPKEELWLRYHNYNLIQEGKPTIDKIPEGVDIDMSEVFRDVIKFYGEQPV